MKQTKRNRKALRGLAKMVVWVHDLDRDSAAAGLSRQHLQDAATVRLLDGGVKAVGIGNVPVPEGNPWLNLFINTIRHDRVYFYSVTARLDELVRLERDSGIRSIGATWEASDRGTCEASKLTENVEKALYGLLDYFIYDHGLENRG